MDTHDTKAGADLTRAQRFELSDDIPTNRSNQPTIGDVINARLGRRDVMRGALAVGAMATIGGAAAMSTSKHAYAQSGATFDFEELTAGVDADHHVANGYSANVLIRWGDPVVPGAPDFDPAAQTAAAQEMQFGYNNDYVGYVSLPAGSNSSDHGLLVVNHEYTNEELMFPGLGRQDGDAEFAGMSAELVGVEMAAHGLSVIEVSRDANGAWTYDPSSSYNRRITAGSTEMTMAGPVAGNPRVQTSADPSGTTVIGTINNCAGGMTPWGTTITAEENFHGYFLGEVSEESPEFRNHTRYGVPGGWYTWGRYEDRFDVGREPNEPNRFGWIVEIDPYNPDSAPIKHTAMGRFKHEGAGIVLNDDGRVVAYMGDDQRFDYMYKYISNGTFDASAGTANSALLDDGVLYVARFNEDGTVDWLPLVYGEGPLTEDNGFTSQADVLIETRLAADLLGATPMDRPEEVDVNPTNGRIYAMLTNNTRRDANQLNVANPRPENAGGHIIEIVERDSDYTATQSDWSILVLAGDPGAPEVGAMWNEATTENGWFISPDNCAIDAQGRLWIATDGNDYEKSGRTDGVWSMETDGDLRGTSRLFYRVPVGAELCGPMFTPDDTTLFVTIQHPADGGDEWPGFGRASTYDDPSTRWPDFDEAMPPRPSLVFITRDGGGPIGS